MEVREHHISSSNLLHLEAVLHICEQASQVNFCVCVVCVCVVCVCVCGVCAFVHVHVCGCMCVCICPSVSTIGHCRCMCVLILVCQIESPTSVYKSKELAERGV